MSADLLVITDARMVGGHDPGAVFGSHPERPERLRAIIDALKRARLDGMQWAQARPAERTMIERVHDPRYVDRIESLRGKCAILDPDTAVSLGSVEAAWLGAGAAIEAVRAVMEGEARGGVKRAWALVRPPGHHAERDRPMGFCLFNNIAIAAAHAIDVFGIERVLIVDWDVHHGNGTQHIFESRRDVLFFSSHQWPLWPGTGRMEEIGRGEGEGYTINAPLAAGFDDGGYVELYRRLLVPSADQFKPELVLVSAGFDAHQNDPLAGMAMTERGFAALCGIVRDIADRHAHGRIALVLEGGYDLGALSASVLACAQVLCGETPPDLPPSDLESRSVIDRLCAFHAQRWRV